LLLSYIANQAAVANQLRNSSQMARQSNSLLFLRFFADSLRSRTLRLAPEITQETGGSPRVLRTPVTFSGDISPEPLGQIVMVAPA